MATEFTIRVADQPGQLANLSEALARSAINITGLHATPCPDGGYTQFVTDNPDATMIALRDASIEYTVREVLMVTIANEPGSLARLARALGNADVNINALYITMNGQVVLDVSDQSKAQQVAMSVGAM